MHFFEIEIEIDHLQSVPESKSVRLKPGAMENGTILPGVTGESLCCFVGEPLRWAGWIG